MNFSIAAPSPILSDYVKHYWAIENCMPVGQEHIQRIIPNGLPEMIFYLGDKPVSNDESKPISENTLVTSQSNGYYDIKVTGKLSVFSVLFKPHGLSVFLNLPQNKLFNQSVPLKYILKNKTDELENKLYEAKKFKDKVAIMEFYLVRFLEKNIDTYCYNRISACIKTINHHKGMISIEKLASDACLSRKQFERTFSRIVGCSPKQFIKIIRFQNAIKEKSLQKDLSLTALSYHTGYYDQSHMTNDFLKLSGMSPKQYFKDCEPYSDYFC